jgi:hypothetical protein
MGRPIVNESDFNNQLRSWTANHFSISRPPPQVPELLNEVARMLVSIPEFNVLDIVFSSDSGDDGLATITVYGYFEPSAE